MTRKDQIKILDDKIESNTNQYKVDRLNAEISAFSSGDLNKYEYVTRKDLNYKPNALDKANFEFSPSGKAFSMGLDKTAESYQEEGVIKLLKDIRDNLVDGVIRPNNRRDNNNDDDDIIIMMVLMMMMMMMMMIHLIYLIHIVHHIHQIIMMTMIMPICLI